MEEQRRVDSRKKEDENRIHQEFHEERIRSVNEWFEPSSCLKERIIELLEKALEEKKRGIEKLNLEFNKGEKKNGKEKWFVLKIVKRMNLLNL